MKKLILMAVATVLLINFTMAGNAPKNVYTKKIINAIKRELQYPSFAKDKQIDEFVIVSITIGDKGKVKVKEIYSANDELKAYVLQKLESMVIKNIKSDQTYEMKIEFKTEK
jgi:hypothetical protein